jgi:two-component system chemotaxis response regulator CheY
MVVSPRILVGDAGRHTRAMISDVLRSAGFRDLIQAASETDLVKLVDQHRPKIIVMAASFPGLSGLTFAKQIRRGFNFVPRETSIILTTDAPTRSFLEAARTVGVDEVVAVPFTLQTLMARIRSVVERPRPFVDCPTYVGPCRRRVMLQDYKGPMRRAADPEKAPAAGPLWSLEDNRSAVRLCVQKMSEYRSALAPEPYKKLRAIYLSVMKLETRTDQASDDALGEAAKSFGRYLPAIGVRQTPDLALLNDHIECLHTLALDAELAAEQRLTLIASLQSAVQGKIAASQVSPG